MQFFSRAWMPKKEKPATHNGSGLSNVPRVGAYNRRTVKKQSQQGLFRFIEKSAQSPIYRATGSYLKI